MSGLLIELKLKAGQKSHGVFGECCHRWKIGLEIVCFLKNFKVSNQIPSDMSWQSSKCHETRVASEQLKPMKHIDYRNCSDFLNAFFLKH
jgi:hypothetical protein